MDQEATLFGICIVSKLKLNDTLGNTLRVIDENSSMRRLLIDLNRQQGLIRIAEGPLAELRRAGIFDLAPPYSQELERTRQIMEQFVASFCRPEIAEAARLMAEFQKSHLVEVLKRYHQQATSMQQAMERMQTPWLNMQNRLQSVNAFTKLQGIGQEMARIPTFDTALTSALRVDLGNWRDHISWSKNSLTDLEKRSTLYQSLGFDPALTEFTGPAFHEILDIAGVSRERPSLVARYGPPVPPADDEEEEAQLKRTNSAHDWLFRLETQLRRFIDDRMSKAYGVNWPKHRLPNGLYDNWREKKTRAENAGTSERPLIAYADFTDYVKIICRKDNWSEVFSPYFCRREDITESFQRLYPVRLDTMHARLITQDDELLLYVETQRLMKVILSRPTRNNINEK